MSSRAFGRSRGFVVVEAFIALVGAAIIAGIAYPTFARARENARRTSCMSDLKQIGLGFMQYTQDYDSYPPGNGKWASVALYPYLKSVQLFRCPSDAPDTHNDNAEDVLTQRLPGFSYGYNSNIGGARRGIRPADLKAPVLTVLNYEVAARVAGHEAVGNTLSGTGITTKRHLGGANYSFADGHVQWMKPGSVGVAPTSRASEKLERYTFATH